MATKEKEWVECGTCSGSGSCGYCGGSGQVPIIKFVTDEDGNEIEIHDTAPCGGQGGSWQ